MKDRLKANKKHIKIILIVVLLMSLPLTLILVKQVQDQRSSAATPDNLETEAGVLSSSGVSKQNDSGASGGEFVKFAKSNDNPAITIQTPTQNSSVQVGQVRVSFSVQDFNIGLPGNDHLHFYLDSDSSPYMFFDGPGINDDNGVRYNESHTHISHWQSGNSFNISGLPSGSHQIRFNLANGNHIEYNNPEATTTLNFNVSQPPSGTIALNAMITGLNFPTAMQQAPDGRVFFTERETGRVRIINSSWQLQSSAFCQVGISNDLSFEQGLLGLVLDPNFAQNKYVYIWYTDDNPLRNRLVRYTDSNGSCTNETIILDNVPAAGSHNAGKMTFGPDGKLYVQTGDARTTSNSQSLSSLAGKILRLNPDGSAPSDNPYFSNSNSNAKKVYSLGHRNGVGLEFHNHTGDLWQTENGPSSDDEINRIIRGGNYGWPTYQGKVNRSGFIDPIIEINPVSAPTDIISISENSSVYPLEYRNNILYLEWKTGTIKRIVLSGTNLDELGYLTTGYNGGLGGLISAMQGNDGYIYVSSQAGGIYRVTVK